MTMNNGDNHNNTDEMSYAANMWDKFSHAPPSNNNIDKILSFPDIDDMAGVLARAKFKNDEQRIAAVRLAYKNRKFGDNDHQYMLRDLCASTLGAGGLGKILQVQTATNLLAPDMIRAAFGMPKNKKPEEVHRSSDLRSDNTREKEVDNSHG